MTPQYIVGRVDGGVMYGHTKRKRFSSMTAAVRFISEVLLARDPYGVHRGHYYID